MGNIWQSARDGVAGAAAFLWERTGTLAAVESRTSAPVRILRGADRVSLSWRGLYPAGEGAGYAGGIVSSAVDGVRSALAILEQWPS